MQSNSSDSARKRETTHAKLLRFGERQVLAYLYRDENDRLTTVLQVWVAATDEQLRVSVSYPSMPDEAIHALFERMDDEDVANSLEQLGVSNIIAELEANG